MLDAQSLPPGQLVADVEGVLVLHLDHVSTLLVDGKAQNRIKTYESILEYFDLNMKYLYCKCFNMKDLRA